MDPQFRIRFFIISDTHGEDLARCPTEPIDIVIHCGDLTQESKLSEYKQAIQLLNNIDAPIKLVIAGNHDFTLDDTLYRQKLTEAHLPLPQQDQTVKTTYGDFGEARALFDAEMTGKDSGIIFLDEGSHDIDLANGVRLRIYASPFVPSEENHYGYPYDPLPGHLWDIPSDVDVVVTHSPPKGVLDFNTNTRRRAGCEMLFSAIVKARPLMHCFGHIHEAWGAKKVTWRQEEPSYITHMTAVDGQRSEVMQSLAKLKGERAEAKEDEYITQKLKEMEARGYCYAAPELRKGEQTLFVNASIEGPESEAQQLPWLVELDFPRSIT
ncbi:metallophosphoesterase domain-containing protein, partial [Aureobasidium melanogenum]